MGSLLMHASILSIHVSSFLWDFCFFSFLFYFFVYSASFSFYLAFFLFAVFSPLSSHCAHLWPFILPTVIGFTIFTP